MNDHSTPDEMDQKPASIAYRELAHEHAPRVYEYAMLLLGERALAETVAAEAFRRTWEAFRRGDVFGDAEEILFRNVTRDAGRRIARNRDLRGHLPVTTADDRAITAFGIVSNFAPQQRAGVLMAVWAGLGYRVAGIASGLGEGRVADLAFSARQEYRHAQGGAPDAGRECLEVGPRLSAQLDGAERAGGGAEAHLGSCAVCQETQRVFEEFGAMLRGERILAPSTDMVDAALRASTAGSGPRPPIGLRLLRLASGPAVLVAVLVAVLLVFQQCEEPSIRTGIGRTSDVIYARDGEGTVVLDSGSGRELGRVAAGVLTRSGHEVYGTRPRCGPSGGTAIWVVDTGTLQQTDVGCADGRLAVVGADEGAHRVYLADEAAGWSRLVVFDLASRRLVGAVEEPGIEEAFRPDRTLVDVGRSALFSYGVLRELREGADAAGVVMRTDLDTLQVVGWAGLGPSRASGVSLLATEPSGRVLVYDVGGGALWQVDLTTEGRLPRRRDLVAGGPGGEAGTGPVVRGALALSPDGTLAYAVLPGGGIAAVDVRRFEPLRELARERQFAAVGVSSDGRMLYALERDGTYSVLDAGTGESLLRRARGRATEILQINAGE